MVFSTTLGLAWFKAHSKDCIALSIEGTRLNHIRKTNPGMTVPSSNDLSSQLSSHLSACVLICVSICQHLLHPEPCSEIWGRFISQISSPLISFPCSWKRGGGRREGGNDRRKDKEEGETQTTRKQSIPVSQWTQQAPRGPRMLSSKHRH